MLNFTYYGHACFLLDDGKYKILFDPFLTGNPSATIKAEEVKCDYILVTHGHGDHIGDAPEIARQNGAEVVAVPEILTMCETAGKIKGHGMNLGGSLTLPFGKVKMVPALHSSGLPGGISCGFVVTAGGETVYFAGDTALFGDMQLIAAHDKPTWAILPIGDNFTMGIEDAATAAKLLGVRHVIPVHYNTWPVIKQDPAEYKKITEARTSAKVHIVAPGNSLELSTVDAVV